MQRHKEVAVPSSIPSKSASEGEGDDVPIPSVDWKRVSDENEIIPPLVKPILPDQEPPLEETRFDKRKGAVEEGMEDTFPSITE